MFKSVNAIYPGSFNPLHDGHLDLINRAAKIFNKVYVVISNNIYKKYSLSATKRAKLVQQKINHLNIKNVIVKINNNLTINFAKKYKISVIIRGLRNVEDFIYETNIAQTNNRLSNKIETFFMLANNNFKYLSSTAIQYLKDIKKNAMFTKHNSKKLK